MASGVKFKETELKHKIVECSENEKSWSLDVSLPPSVRHCLLAVQPDPQRLSLKNCKLNRKFSKRSKDLHGKKQGIQYTDLRQKSR